MTINRHGQLEYDALLSRLEALLPVRRQQQRRANDLAHDQWFSQPGREKLAVGEYLVLSMDDILGIEYQVVDTPEQQELMSIGRAVAAFGGSDAISKVGWDLCARGCKDGQYVWSVWDGLAGHWL